MTSPSTHPAERETPSELSEAAKDLCAAWFMNGTKCTVRSHESHKVMKSRQAAVDELVAAGIITREPFNQYGSVLLTGTDQAGEIGRAQGIVMMKREGWL